jgi:hypothetical protein
MQDFIVNESSVIITPKGIQTGFQDDKNQISDVIKHDHSTTRVQ